MFALCNCVWCVCVEGGGGGALKEIFSCITFRHIMHFLDIFNSFQYYFVYLFFPKQSVIYRHVSLTLNCT